MVLITITITSPFTPNKDIAVIGPSTIDIIIILCQSRITFLQFKRSKLAVQARVRVLYRSYIQKLSRELYTCTNVLLRGQKHKSIKL
jgi:hypothetical protein